MKKYLLVLVIALLGSLPINAQKKSLNIDLTEMVQVENVSAPVISPNGKYLAYSVRWAVVEDEKSTYKSHIWVAATDGSWNKQFTRGEHSISNPTFTPDNEYLSFTSNRDDKTQLFRISLSGGEAEQITDIETGVSGYKWSPDGSKIAFLSTDDDSKEWKDKKKSKTDVTVVDSEFRQRRIYVQNIGSNPLNNDPKVLYSGDIYTVSFDWSPDGNSIVFAHKPSPLLDDGDLTDISIVPADSGAITSLVSQPGTDSSPIFTSDGKHVVFLSDGGQPEPIGLSDAYIISANGGKITPLAKSFDRNIGSLLKGDNKNAVYFSEGRRTLSAFYELPLNGDAPKRLTPNDALYSFAQGPVNGIIAFTKQKSNMFEEVYVSPVKKMDAKKISSFGENYQLPKLPKVETITWKSKDGLEIEGLLIYPLNYQKGKKYPLFLNVHGGPGGVYSDSYLASGAFYNAAYFAKHGYAILKPNPRGSNSYGKEFRYANFMDIGESDYEDIITGVDHVIDMGIAHQDSLVMAGWSYGGYMAARIATKTDRFKAISMGAGLYNLESMFFTTDVTDYGVGLMGGGYWETEEMKALYAKLSPHAKVDEVTTPLQLLHSSNDQRVPASQSFEMYRVLKRLGVETELVLYPRSGHGPSEPKLSVDVGERVLYWFDRYLDK